jgi:hypothetical protein
MACDKAIDAGRSCADPALEMGPIERLGRGRNSTDRRCVVIHHDHLPLRCRTTSKELTNHGDLDTNPTLHGIITDSISRKTRLSAFDFDLLSYDQREGLAHRGVGYFITNCNVFGQR